MEPNPRVAAFRSGPQDPAPVWPSALRSGPAPMAAAKPDRLEILRRAEGLEIPWERILLEEIQAEQTLKRYSR